MSCQDQCSEARNGEPCRFCLCQHHDEYDTTTVSVIAISDFGSDDDSSSSPMLNGG
jgi:hypothetical protein